jgi:hypothetical protein
MKTADPQDRMGVYARLDEVPDRHRLGNYIDAYAGRDVWGEWVDSQGEISDALVDNLRRANDSWSAFVTDRGRHPALAQPSDVVAWSAVLLDANRSVRTAYRRYWVQVEKFYTWLQNHVDYPHVYHPFWMAVVEDRDGATGEIWDEKTARTGDSS